MISAPVSFRGAALWDDRSFISYHSFPILYPSYIADFSTSSPIYVSGIHYKLCLCHALSAIPYIAMHFHFLPAAGGRLVPMGRECESSTSLLASP
jgi:hypothetical protein